MTGFLAIAALGFFLGMRHATDADHVIAISTIVARQGNARSVALIGAVWGVGHTLTILVVGGGIILLGWVIPPRVGLTLELSVGAMLIILGIINLTGVLGRIPRRVPPHPSSPDFGAPGLYQTLRPLVVGIVHGLAGSAAVALLVLATISDPTWGILYLLVFGSGTIAGMTLITVVIAWPIAYTGVRFSRFNRGLRVASGLVSLGFGLLLAYQVGIVDGLFTGHASWTPR